MKQVLQTPSPKRQIWKTSRFQRTRGRGDDATCFSMGSRAGELVLSRWSEEFWEVSAEGWTEERASERETVGYTSRTFKGFMELWSCVDSTYSCFYLLTEYFSASSRKNVSYFFLLNYFYKRIKFSSALPRPVNHSAGIWTLWVLSFIFVLIKVLFFIKNK